MHGETGTQYFWNVFIPGTSNPLICNPAIADAFRNDYSPFVTLTARTPLTTV